jgi:hypothetical protein
MNEKGVRRELLHQGGRAQPLRYNRAQPDEMSAIRITSPRVRGMVKDQIHPKRTFRHAPRGGIL